MITAGPTGTSDVIALRVSSTVPAERALAVSINAKIVATFNEELKSSTTNPITFTLKQGTTSVSGTVNYAGATATFTPSSILAANTEFTATITTRTENFSENNTSSRYEWSFTTGSTQDATAPTVSFTVPVNDDTSVPVNTKIAATFSEAMDPLTITTERFTLKQGTTSISGTVIYARTTAAFAPSSILAANTEFTAKITTGAKDLAGNALSRYVWSFTTGSTPDTTAPVVSSTSPVNAATAVSVNQISTQKISATFSEAMDPLTITTETFTLRKGTTPIPGVVTYAGSTATFTLGNNFATDAIYTATVAVEAKDLAGNGLTINYVWMFTTQDQNGGGSGSAPPDTTRPTVSSTTPADAATDVPINQTITATFSEAMDPLTINQTTFTLRDGITPVSGNVTYTGATATFTPSSNLAFDTEFTATITTGAEDLAGNALVANNNVWEFTTQLLAPAGPEPVNLRSAASFSALAGSTITNAGPTNITGNLGLSPGTSVIGIPPGTVDGEQHITDSTAATAKLDLTTAYNDAAGRTLEFVSVSGNLGGQILPPGLYTSISTLGISAGQLTLDGEGNPNSVWIFQVASELTIAGGTAVILVDGAEARNIFWQVGTSATLGANVVFKGTIMADQTITLATGADLEGRALARDAAVTLVNNIITIPTP